MLDRIPVLTHLLVTHLSNIAATLDSAVVSMGPTHLAFGAAVVAQGVAHVLLRGLRHFRATHLLRAESARPSEAGFLTLVEGGASENIDDRKAA